jgi:hypothetical protein
MKAVLLAAMALTTLAGCASPQRMPTQQMPPPPQQMSQADLDMIHASEACAAYYARGSLAPYNHCVSEFLAKVSSRVSPVGRHAAAPPRSAERL